MEFKRNYILIPSQLCAKPRIAPKEEVCVGNVHDYTSVKHDSDEKPPRKKACLTHMSDDEKNLRRKMKNRESAQSARDRKKNYVDSLEKRVQELVAEKETLLQAKLFVDQRNQNLEKENSLLREKLNGARQGNLGTKMDEKSDSYHWEKVCRQLMTEKEDLCAKLRDLEDQLACKVTQPVLELTSGGNSDQLEHFYPIEATEVEVKTSEESSESAALLASLQQSHFLQAFVTLISVLHVALRLPTVSEEYMTLWSHAPQREKGNNTYHPLTPAGELIQPDGAPPSALIGNDLYLPQGHLEVDSFLVKMEYKQPP